jgi:hypothetical protein
MHKMKNMSRVGLLCMQQWSSQIHKRHVIHSNSAWHGVLFCEICRSHICVGEDYALSTGEGLRTFRLEEVPSSWTSGPEDGSNFTSWQGEMSQTTWILTDTTVRISPPPTVVPKCQQETTNGRCVKSQKSATKHLWTNLTFQCKE